MITFLGRCYLRSRGLSLSVTQTMCDEEILLRKFTLALLVGMNDNEVFVATKKPLCRFPNHFLLLKSLSDFCQKKIHMLVSSVVNVHTSLQTQPAYCLPSGHIHFVQHELKRF